MAINFPDSPTTGQTYSSNGRTWVYQESVWKIMLDGQQQMVVSDTAPSSPVSGDLWFNSTTGAAYVYYDSYWIEFGVQTSPTMALNVDGGRPGTIYGGISSLNGGGVN